MFFPIHNILWFLKNHIGRWIQPLHYLWSLALFLRVVPDSQRYWYQLTFLYGLIWNISSSFYSSQADNRLYYTVQCRREGFIDIVQDTFHCFAVPDRRKAMWGHLEFLLFPYILVFPSLSVSWKHIVLRIHTSPWGVWSRYTSSMLCCNLSKE